MDPCQGLLAGQDSLFARGGYGISCHPARLTDEPLPPAMNRILTLAFVLITAAASASGFPKGSPNFAASFKEVQARAKKSGKPMILIFSAVYCPPCQVMKEEVYPSEVVKPFHDKFEWAYLDLMDRDNIKTAEQFHVSPIPDIRVLGNDGKELVSQNGPTNAEDFARTLEKALKLASKPVK